MMGTYINDYLFNDIECKQQTFENWCSLAWKNHSLIRPNFILLIKQVFAYGILFNTNSLKISVDDFMQDDSQKLSSIIYPACSV